MDQPNIEIHEVRAHRVDRAGRVCRLRIIGVAHRADQRIQVEACVGLLGGPDRRSWRDQGAEANARALDPSRTFANYSRPEFLADFFTGERRHAHLWDAEVDLLAAPSVPPIVIGRQPVSVNVRACYTFGDGTYAMYTCDEIEATEEFDLGVLFVHGIGRQRRAETLVQWSAPLLRWTNAWLIGATYEIAGKLRDTLSHSGDETGTKHLHEAMQGWHNSFVVRGDMSQVDHDYAKRSDYAEALAREVLAPTFKTWRDELKAKIRRLKAMSEQRCPTPEEKAAAHKVIGALEGIKASAVGGSAEFRDAYILDVGARSADPSSVEMHVEAMAPDGYMLRSRWMLSESHWADTFWAPSFFRFGRWCLLTAPILLVHYVATARLRHPMWLRWIVAVFGFAVAVTLAQVVFLLLAMLWVIPWRRWRAGLLHVQLELAGVVGDSYVLLEDPVQRRAILDRFDRNLEWLAQRCRRVVVIAHSQGAAVAELALSERVGIDKIQSMATLGSGVQTLRAIDGLAHNRSARAAGWVAIGCVLLLGAAAVLALLHHWPLALLLGVVASLALIRAARAGCDAHQGRPSTLPRAALLRPWFDFYARRDLVSYGPFVDPQNNGNIYRPKEVRNRDSYAADHVTYWQNAEQVVGPLARLMGSAAGFNPLSELLPSDDATLARLERSRLSRLRFLHAARFVMLLATAMLLYTNSDALLAVGSWAVIWLQLKLALAVDTAPAPALVVWFQVLVVLVPFVVHKSLVNAIFDGWTTVEVEQLLRRSAGTPATYWVAMFTTVLVIELMGTIEYVWPMRWLVVAPAAAASAIVSGWIARSVHVSRTDAPDCGTRPVAAKETGGGVWLDPDS